MRAAVGHKLPLTSEILPLLPVYSVVGQVMYDVYSWSCFLSKIGLQVSWSYLKLQLIQSRNGIPKEDLDLKKMQIMTYKLSLVLFLMFQTSVHSFSPATWYLQWLSQSPSMLITTLPFLSNTSPVKKQGVWGLQVLQRVGGQTKKYQF